MENPSISDDESVPYVRSHGYAASSIDFARSPSLDVPPPPCREAPEVMSFSPTNGPDGCKVVVYLQSVYELLTPPSCTFAVTFGSAQCDCAITPLGFQNSAFQYALLVDAPAFTLTGCASFSVPLQMIVNGNDGLPAQVSHLGNFTYNQDTHSSPLRKRRMSTASEETCGSIPSGKQVRMDDGAAAGYACNGAVSHSSNIPQYLPNSGNNCVYPAGQCPSESAQSLMPTLGHAKRRSDTQLRVAAPSPLSASWSPAFSAASAATESPTLSATPVSHGSGMPSPAKTTANPPLIRTSTIQQSLAGPTGPSHGQSFNPYAMYPSKAVLKLNGNLDAMTEGWSKEERDCQRRLVQFTRCQSGSTISADFKPVSPADRPSNSICVSCIYWADKDECFVTSVDSIYLLESLVGVRFTVEEKNRIRRNLEGFRPLTVSKAKSDSEDFFKVIMGFPNPKPRNIEKDVKAFPWRILAHALKKIIGKYVSILFFLLSSYFFILRKNKSLTFKLQSASYSSTAGALPSSMLSNQANGDVSDSAAGTRAPSPQSAADCVENLESFGFSSQPAAAAGVPFAESQVPRTTTTTTGLQAMNHNGNGNPQHGSLAAPYGQPPMHLAPGLAAASHPGPYAFNFVHKDSVAAIPPQQPGLLYGEPLPLAHGLPTTIYPLGQATTGS